MKAGTARINLTPDPTKPFYLLGYRNPARNEPAKGVHDEIFGNALLLDDGKDKVFIWSADLLELPDQTAEVIKTRLHDIYGLDRDHILLSVTHNHSSIRDFHIDWPYGKFSPEYYEFFIGSVLKAYEQCEKNKRPATARTGREVIEGFYGNRNHPGESADNEVILVRFYDETGKPFACLLNWAVHSTELGASNLYLTGDLAGNVCRKLGERWGYYPVILNGAAGDSSNRYQRKGKDFAELERASEGLAERIEKIETPKEVTFGPCRYQTLSHTIAPDKERYDAHLKVTLQDLKEGRIHLSDTPAPALVEKCEEQLASPPFFDTLCFEVLDLGDLRFYCFPGELGSKFGKELKASTDKTALIAGYTNGFHYYFLPAQEYGTCFETIGNPVPPGEPEKIIAKMIQSGEFLEK